MKGLALPINIIVAVVVVVLVLVTIVAFFLGTSGSQANDVNANKLYADGCQRYCSSASVDESYLSSYEIAQNDKQFLNACISLGHGTEEYPIKCLESCGCDTSVTKADIGKRLQELIGKMKSA